jgi:hypothetical protein
MMTYREKNDLLKKVSVEGFHSAVVFYRDPITETTQSRNMLSTDKSEVVIWAGKVNEVYTDFGIPYEIYVDGESCYGTGASSRLFLYSEEV